MTATTTHRHEGMARSPALVRQDLKDIEVPVVTRFIGVMRRYREAAAKLLDGDFAEAQRLADDWILGSGQEREAPRKNLQLCAKALAERQRVLAKCPRSASTSAGTCPPLVSDLASNSSPGRNLDLTWFAVEYRRSSARASR